MMRTAAFLLFTSILYGQKSGADSGVGSLLDVKRIYVAELKGGPQADALRELIIASLDSTRLFILTENPDRADAVLKGAADDHAFVDEHEKSDSASGHGAASIATGAYSTRRGVVASEAGAESESFNIKERKHEAYAAVRLCNKEGDVLWSTTQESLGAKFRGAGADVAAKIARQMTLDVERARRTAAVPSVPAVKP